MDLIALSTKKAMALPYATDGLVVCLDAIWNGGLRWHVDSAKTWTDLSGNGHDAIANSNKVVSFANGYADFVSGTYMTVSGINVTGDKTIEMVVSFPSRNTSCLGYGYWARNQYAVGLGNYCCLLRASDHTTVRISNKYYGSAVDTIVHCCLRQGNGSQLYGNGDLVASSAATDYVDLPAFALNVKWDSGATYAGKVYALRIYDRALTDAEIASNYAIDKERFNF